MRIDRLASAQLAACAAAAALAAALSGCGQENRYVAPPPPKVSVAIPVQQKVTRYLEATGYTSAINTTNLVARVQGFLEKINYKDGDEAKEGGDAVRHRARAVQAQARAGAGRRGRRLSLIEAGGSGVRTAVQRASRQVTSKQALDNATANRDSARARLKQAEVDTAQAALNLGYTEVKAPFDASSPRVVCRWGSW